MARPIKDGVDYFPMDTGFYKNDDKVRLLRAEFGAKGMYLLNYLLCEIYGQNGYFLKWDNNKCFLVSDGAGCGCNPEFISEFISGALRCSLFDERVFKVFGVLTSAGIQRRYLRMLNSRDYIVIFQEYWLLDVNDKKDVPTGVLNKLAFKKVSCKGNGFKNKGNSVKTKGNTQSKGKDTIISQRESKRNNAPPSLKEIEDFCSQENIKINSKKFYYYYNSKNWIGIYDWKSKIREWSVTEKQDINSEYGAYNIDLYETMLNNKE